MPPARDWLTTGEAARLLGCSHDTVARLVDRGLLPAERLHAGSPRRIRAADVEAFRVAMRVRACAGVGAGAGEDAGHG